MIRASVTDNGKREFDRLLKKFQGNGSYVTVGVHEDAGSYTEGPNPPSVIEVALWNEFGTRTIPERSFLRATIDQNQDLINRWRLELLREVVFGKMSVEKALATLGFRIQTLIQGSITGYHIEPPNKPATIEAKRRAGVTPPDQPLYRTGLLLRSITFRVHLG